MIDRKKLLVIVGVGLIGLLFFILIVISAFTNKETDQIESQTSPTPEQVIIPTSSAQIPSKNIPNTTDQLQLVSTEPQDGSLNTTPITQISMTFSEPINERKFYYKTTPISSTLISSNENTITITPKEIWQNGQNIITVYAETESISGKRLSTPFTYSFTVQEIPFPDEEFNE